jgi:sugar phosphate isomerase/epimerase
MGYKLELPQQVDLAAKAGYQAIEFWLRDIERFVQSGGNLRDVRKQLEDYGLKVVGGINFNAWASEDDREREKAVETFRRDMDWIAALGGTAIAAAPAGIFQPPPVDLRRLADRYRVLLDLGENYGVVPQLEIWGASANLSRVSEALFVAAEVGHPRAQLLLDVFHMYKGGSSPQALKLIHGGAMTNFHLNDYPAEPPRQTIRDGHRVFPGDGVAPLSEILRSLYEIGFRGALSLELFNQEYWKKPPAEMARVGLTKMQSAVAAALGARQ